MKVKKIVDYCKKRGICYLYDDEKLILILNYSGKNNKITLKAVENSVVKRGVCSYERRIFDDDIDHG